MGEVAKPPAHVKPIKEAVNSLTEALKAGVSSTIKAAQQITIRAPPRPKSLTQQPMGEARGR